MGFFQVHFSSCRNETAATKNKTGHVEGRHSVAWINEPQRRPHWDFRCLLLCGLCWLSADNAAGGSGWAGEGDEMRKTRPGCAPTFLPPSATELLSVGCAPDFGLRTPESGDWWQKLNYDSKWTAAGWGRGRAVRKCWAAGNLANNEIHEFFRQ